MFDSKHFLSRRRMSGQLLVLLALSSSALAQVNFNFIAITIILIEIYKNVLSQ